MERQENFRTERKQGERGFSTNAFQKRGQCGHRAQKALVRLHQTDRDDQHIVEDEG